MLIQLKENPIESGANNKLKTTNQETGSKTLARMSLLHVARYGPAASRVLGGSCHCALPGGGGGK